MKIIQWESVIIPEWNRNKLVRSLYLWYSSCSWNRKSPNFVQRLNSELRPNLLHSGGRGTRLEEKRKIWTYADLALCIKLRLGFSRQSICLRMTFLLESILLRKWWRHVIICNRLNYDKFFSQKKNSRKICEYAGLGFYIRIG